jgi:hypothetical protein
LTSRDRPRHLALLIAQGESETRELYRAGQTLRAFSSGEGGQELCGVVPDGKLVGQDVAALALQYIAAMIA